MRLGGMLREGHLLTTAGSSQPTPQTQSSRLEVIKEVHVRESFSAAQCRSAVSGQRIGLGLMTAAAAIPIHIHIHWVRHTQSTQRTAHAGKHAHSAGTRLQDGTLSNCAHPS